MKFTSHIGLREGSYADGCRITIDLRDRYKFTSYTSCKTLAHSYHFHRRSCRISCSPQLVGLQIEETAKDLWTRLGNSEPLQSGKIIATASDAPQVIPQQITRHNFEAALPRVREVLMNCSFFAFDCEFSGIATEVRNPLLVQFDDPSSRYERILHNAQTYQVMYLASSSFSNLWHICMYCIVMYFMRFSNYACFPLILCST
jgi:hypothetical protein